MNEELKVIISASVDGFKHAINEATEGIEGIEGSSNKMKDTISGAIDFITNKYTMLAAGAVATGKAMFDAAMKSAATADEIDKQSQKIGLSRQAYQELDYVLSQNGASMSNMSGAMKTLTSAMDSASKGNVNAANTFKTLGVSITNADGTLKSQEEVL